MTVDVAGVVFAETRDLKPVSNDVAGTTSLSTLRQALARLVQNSGDGVGFAAPQRPTVADLGSPSVLQAWQDCTSAAGNPANGPSPQANVAYRLDSNPKDDAAEKIVNPWLSVATDVASTGDALRNGRPVKLWLMRSALTSGSFPRDPTSIDYSIGAAEPGFTSMTAGAVLFALCLVLLCVPARLAFQEGKDSVASVCSHFKPDKPSCLKALRQLDADDGKLAKAKAESKGDTAGVTLVTTDQNAVEKDLAALYPTGDAAVASSSVVPYFVVSMAGIVALMALIGYGMRGQVFGFLIDERGRMSLSRFQLVAWTVAILPAYWIAAAWNIGLGNAVDASVLPAMSADLWVLLSIVTTSPLVSGLVLGVKSTPPAGAASDAPNGPAPPASSVPPAAVDNRWVVDVRNGSRAWSFLDLFIGEEVSNRSSVDISRVQQFIFTLVTLFAFGALVVDAFSGLDAGRRIVELPPLDRSLVGLLALSHAAYLVAKAVPKTGATGTTAPANGG